MIIQQQDYKKLLERVPKAERFQLHNICTLLLKEMNKMKINHSYDNSERANLLRELMNTSLSDFVALYKALGNTDKLLLNNFLESQIVDNTTTVGTIIVLSVIGSYYADLKEEIELKIKEKERVAESKEKIRELHMLIGEIYYNQQCLRTLGTIIKDKEGVVDYVKNG